MAKVALERERKAAQERENQALRLAQEEARRAWQDPQVVAEVEAALAQALPTFRLRSR